MRIAPVSFNSENTISSNLKQNSAKNYAVDNRQISYQIQQRKRKTAAAAILLGAAAIVTAIILKRKAPVQNIAASAPVQTNAASSAEKSKNIFQLMTGKELLNELKILKPENYIASVENINSGTFLADLHSHSLYSDGKASVKDILDKVALYADYAHEKTGKQFIFSLTDHDSIEGVKEAVKIISSNPQKYKNVKFIPGVEMSFAIKADKTANPFETAEVLVYGFNPSDKKIEKFLEEIQAKRKKLTIDFIENLKQKYGYADFSYEEFRKIYNSGRDYFMMNNQWKVHHYAQTKNAAAGLANSKGTDKSQFYEQIMAQTDNNKTLSYLREKGLVPSSYGDDNNITALCKEKFSPVQRNNGTYYAGENSFDSIVRAFGGDDNVFFALAHPYYLTERTNHVSEAVRELNTKSYGLLKASESFHQAYNSSLDRNAVEKLNKELVSDNEFLELGGCDNHLKDWLSEFPVKS